METVIKGKQPATREVLDDLQSSCCKQNQKIQMSIAEILSAAKKLKHAFETSATKVKELLLQNEDLSKSWTGANEVLAKATSPTQMSMLNELIDGLESAYSEHSEDPNFDSKPNSVDLLMIGSAGNGKSATGNSILCNAAFHTATGMSATESSSRIATSSYKDLRISVVETPGVDTSGKNKFEVLEILINSIKESLELCNYSFTALLIVIKFGSRFTQHESDTVKMIRGVLGNDVIQKYGVCVVTHGDNFEYEMEEEEDEEGKVMTFEEWCRAQVGEIGEIFKECNFRCVLFNNKTKSETKKLEQIENLLSRINFDQNYCKADFIAADEGLAKLTHELFLPEIIKQTCTFVDDIRSKSLSLGPKANNANDILKTKELIQEVQEYKENIIAGVWDDSQLSQILGYLEPLEMQLKSQIKLGNPSTTMSAQSGRDFNAKNPTSDFSRMDLSDKESFVKEVTYGKKVPKIKEPNNEPRIKETEKFNTALEKKCKFDLKCLKKNLKASNKCADDIKIMANDLEAIARQYSVIFSSSEKYFKKFSKLKLKLNPPAKYTDDDMVSKRWTFVFGFFKGFSKKSKAHKTPGNPKTNPKPQSLETIL